jgi:hypothetical protein
MSENLKAVFLKDLSENNIDKLLVNEDLKAGGELTFCWGESWFFTFTNGDNSSKTGGNCGNCIKKK